LATLTVLVPPRIVVQPPTNQMVLPGTNVTITVEATGSEPLSYRWWRFGTNWLAGETNTSLVLSNVTLTQAGDYTVEVTNLVGAVTSSVSRVTVLAPPVIRVEPADQVVSAGSNATLEVVAEGTLPLRYQWYWEGTNAIPNATNAVLLLPNVPVTNTFGFCAVVTNSLGAVTSRLARVTVDSDRDGMPDYWELAHGLDPNNPLDKDQDADGDEMTNGQEWVAGTDPRDPLSVLKVLSITDQSGAQLEFLAMPNIGYTVLYSTNLVAPAWGSLTNVPPRPGTNIVRVVDPAAAQGARYYRIVTPMRSP
jgi:hypothetical protein